MAHEVLQDLSAAKENLEQAEQRLTEAVKRGIREGLIETFSNSGIQNVVFGVCTAPYNDENPGQGVFGPLVNLLDEDESITSDYDGAGYELFYNYGGPTATADAPLLSAVLKGAGWEPAANALGVSYYPGEGGGDNVVFVARRTDDGFSLEENSVGY